MEGDADFKGSITIIEIDKRDGRFGFYSNPDLTRGNTCDHQEDRTNFLIPARI